MADGDDAEVSVGVLTASMNPPSTVAETSASEDKESRERMAANRTRGDRSFSEDAAEDGESVVVRRVPPATDGSRSRSLSVSQQQSESEDAEESQIREKTGVFRPVFEPESEDFSYIGGRSWRDGKASESAESSKLSQPALAAERRAGVSPSHHPVMHDEMSAEDVSVSRDDAGHTQEGEAGKKHRHPSSARKKETFVFEESTDAESASESEVGK